MGLHHWSTHVCLFSCLHDSVQLIPAERWQPNYYCSTYYWALRSTLGKRKGRFRRTQEHFSYPQEKKCEFHVGHDIKREVSWSFGGRRSTSSYCESSTSQTSARWRVGMGRLSRSMDCEFLNSRAAECSRCGVLGAFERIFHKKRGNR